MRVLDLFIQLRHTLELFFLVIKVRVILNSVLEALFQLNLLHDLSFLDGQESMLNVDFFGNLAVSHGVCL